MVIHENLHKTVGYRYCILIIYSKMCPPAQIPIICIQIWQTEVPSWRNHTHWHDNLHAYQVQKNEAPLLVLQCILLDERATCSNWLALHLMVTSFKPKRDSQRGCTYHHQLKIHSSKLRTHLCQLKYRWYQRNNSHDLPRITTLTSQTQRRRKRKEQEFRKMYQFFSHWHRLSNHIWNRELYPKYLFCRVKKKF